MKSSKWKFNIINAPMYSTWNSKELAVVSWSTVHHRSIHLLSPAVMFLGDGWSPDYCYTSSSSTSECHTDTRRQVVPGVMPRTEAKVSKAPQLVSMPQHVWLKCLAVHHNNKMWHFSEAVKLQSKKWSWLGTAPEDRCRAFNLLIMGKMEEDKIPIQPFLQGPKWSHCNPTGYLGHGRKFLKTNILEYNHTNSINAPNSSATWKLWSQCLLVRSEEHFPTVGTKKINRNTCIFQDCTDILMCHMFDCFHFRL